MKWNGIWEILLLSVYSWFELVKVSQPCIAHVAMCNCYTSMSSLAFSSLNLCEACQHLFAYGLIYSLDTKINLLYVSDLLSSTQIFGGGYVSSLDCFLCCGVIVSPPPRRIGFLPSLCTHVLFLPDSPQVPQGHRENFASLAPNMRRQWGTTVGAPAHSLCKITRHP